MFKSAVHKIVLATAIALVAAAPASAAKKKYDYVRDVLIGNTVEIAEIHADLRARYFFAADNTVIKHMKGSADEQGVWRETKKDLCTTYPSEGKEFCSAKPKNVKVPSTKTLKGALPDGTKFHIVFTWIKGQVRYE